MIALLGPRPFEKDDPYDEAMLGSPAAGAPPPPPKPQGGDSKKDHPLGEGIEGGGGVQVPHPQGIEAGVASTKAEL